MRKVFRSRLPNERDVLTQVRAIAKRYNVAAPRVEFWERGDAKCEPDGVLYLPKPEWVEIVQPDIRHPVYWMLTAHEVSHYIASVLGKVNPQHNNGFYAVLLAITLVWQLPLDAMWDEEYDYIPRALERGMRAAGEVLEATLMAGANALP